MGVSEGILSPISGQDVSTPQENHGGLKRMGIVEIDLGSTAAKVAAHAVLPGSGLVEQHESEWVDWSSRTMILEFPELGIMPFKCIGGEDLGQLLNGIRQAVDENTSLLDEIGIAPIVLGMTGFSNSLVVHWSDGVTGQRETVLLLDNPSLHTNDWLPMDQQRVLEEQGLSTNPKDLQIKSLMKLLMLKNNPELVRELCGSDVEFSDLTFSTMLGLLGDTLSNRQDTGIPVDDLRGFGDNSFAQQPQKARALFRGLGISDEQIPINPSSTVQSAENHNIFLEENDWMTEAKLIRYLREQRTIDDNAVVIALDTVGKLVHPKFGFPKVSLGSGERYTTQRMTGGINPQWLKPLFHTDSGLTDFNQILRILENLSLRESNVDQFYFDPDDHSEGNERGTLYLFDENHRGVVLHPNQLPELSEEEQNQAVLAIALGTFFALRQKIEKVLPSEEEFPPIVQYGGLGSNGGHVWSRLFRQVFSQSPVYRLEDIGGFTSVGYATAMKLDVPVEGVAVNSHYCEPEQMDREREYKQWQEIRANLSQS